MKAGFDNLLGNIQTRISKNHYVIVGAIILVAAIIGGTSSLVYAGKYDAQINKLKQQNSQSKEDKQELQTVAGGISEKIDGLRAEISSLEKQIGDNRAKDAELQTSIKKAETDLAYQKEVLGLNIKQMYVENEMSTLEMLASSRDLGDYIDRAQYRNSVQSKINDTLQKINALKKQLDDQRQEVQRLMDSQKAMQARVKEQKAENDRLLAMNKSEQSALDSDMKKRSAEISELQRKQAQENVRLFGGGSSGGSSGGGGGGTIGGGGYPWGNAPCIHTGRVDGSCPNYDWGINGSPWNWNLSGYGYRNCTDWVAYRVKVAGGYVPSGLGNAKNWDDRRPSSSTPSVGAAAISNSGYYGHVMYVEAVNGDGSIVISDYNRAGTGKYDKSTLSASKAASLRYVQF